MPNQFKIAKVGVFFLRSASYRRASKKKRQDWRFLAERTGFEPADVSISGFQDQCLQPLGHLSTSNYTIKRQNML